MRGRKRTHVFDEDEAVRRYVAGESSKAIALSVGSTPAVILGVLRRKGVAIRKMGPKGSVLPESVEIVKREYEQGASATQIAKKLGVSHYVVEKHLKLAGVVLRGTTAFGHVDEGFFDVILSEEQAYVLGFFSADGCVKSDNCISFEVANTDAQILQDIAQAMKWKGKVSINNEAGRGTLQIKSKRLHDALLKKGFVEGKKSVTCVPVRVDENLERHFWRGVIDGDGSLPDLSTGRELLCMVGTKEVCQGFKDFLKMREIQSEEVHKCTGMPLWTVAVNGQEAVAAMDLLYGASTIALQRKKIIAQGVVEDGVRPRVERIGRADAESFIARHHYLKTMPGICKAYGWFEGGLLRGVATVSSPTGPATAASIFGEEHSAKVRELSRFCMVDKAERKFPASAFLAGVMKLVHKEEPELWALVSFADSAVGHTGKIYEAVGGVCVGETGEEVFYESSGGDIVSSKGKYAVDMLKKTGIPLEDWRLRSSGGKKKYVLVLVRGRDARKKVFDKLVRK